MATWHFEPNVLQVHTSNFSGYKIVTGPFPSPPPQFWIKPIYSYHIMAVTDLKKQHKYLIIIKKYKKREKVLAACQKYLTLSPDLGAQHVSMCIVKALA